MRVGLGSTTTSKPGMQGVGAFCLAYDPATGQKEKNGGKMPGDATSKSLTDRMALDALPKQRRFLILMSMALIAYYALGLRFKDLQFQGAAFEIAKKGNAVIGLWLVWGWALLRYLQRSYELLSDVVSDITLDYRAEDERIARKKARRATTTSLEEEKNVDPRFTGLHVDSVSLGAPGPYVKMYAQTRSGGRIYPEISASYVRFSEDGKLSDGASGHGITMEWTRLQTSLHSIRAWTIAVIGLPAVTEHVAPLVLATVAALGPMYDNHEPIKEPVNPMVAEKCIVIPPTMKFGCRTTS